jgi:transcriptional regulator with XRE-family HTH domain
MQDAPSQLRSFMERKGLTQASLAKAADVSQPTISRALRGITNRRGPARDRLFKYAGISSQNYRPNMREATERLVAAFDRLQGHSHGHAETIVRIIDALADLAKPVSEEIGNRWRRTQKS